MMTESITKLLNFIYGRKIKMMNFDIYEESGSGFYIIETTPKPNQIFGDWHKRQCFFYYTKAEIISMLKQLAYDRFGIKRAHFNIYL